MHEARRFIGPNDVVVQSKLYPPNRIMSSYLRHVSTDSSSKHIPSSPSGITSTVIVDDELGDCQRLLRLFQSCFGPRGKKQCIKGAGDADAIRAFTSASSRLIASLKVKNPFNSLVVGGVKNQIDKQQDGGSLMALLTLQLTLLWREEARNSKTLSTALAAEILEVIFDCLLAVTIEKMAFRMDISSCADLASIVRSVLTSNSIFFNADSSKVDHIVSLVLRIFVAAIRGSNGIDDDDDDASGRSMAFFSMPHVEYRHLYGLDFGESSLRDGVLLPAPNEWDGEINFEIGNDGLDTLDSCWSSVEI